MLKQSTRRLLKVGDLVRVQGEERNGMVTTVGRGDVTVRMLINGKIEHRRFDREALRIRHAVVPVAVAVPILDAIPVLV